MAFHSKTIPLARRLSAAAAQRLTETITASLRGAENKTKPSGGRRCFKNPFDSTNDLRCFLASADVHTKKETLKVQKSQMRILFPPQKVLVHIREMNASDFRPQQDETRGGAPSLGCRDQDGHLLQWIFINRSTPRCAPGINRPLNCCGDISNLSLNCK